MRKPSSSLFSFCAFEQLVFLRTPARGQVGRSLFEFGEFLFQRQQAAFRAGVAFLLQRLLLDLSRMISRSIESSSSGLESTCIFSRARPRPSVDRLVGRKRSVI